MPTEPTTLALFPAAPAAVAVTVDSLPAQPISAEVLAEKYAKGDELTVDDVRRRVARALATVEPEAQRADWEARFLAVQQRGFVPAGRINSAAGTTLAATLINCFVQPIGDSVVEIVDGKPGIYSALAAAAGFGVTAMAQGRHWLRLPDGLVVELLQAREGAVAQMLAIDPRAAP